MQHLLVSSASRLHRSITAVDHLPALNQYTQHRAVTLSTEQPAETFNTLTSASFSSARFKWGTAWFYTKLPLCTPEFVLPLVRPSSIKPIPGVRHPLRSSLLGDLLHRRLELPLTVMKGGRSFLVAVMPSVDVGHLSLAAIAVGLFLYHQRLSMVLVSLLCDVWLIMGFDGWPP